MDINQLVAYLNIPYFVHCNSSNKTVPLMSHTDSIREVWRVDILFAYVLLGIHQTDNIFQGILGKNVSHLVKLGLCMWPSGKESTCKCRWCRSLIPGLGRFPGGGHGNPLQDSCREHPMGRGAWQATWLRSLAHIVPNNYITRDGD